MTDSAWRCHARPAALAGKTCGHLNMPRECLKRDGLACCSECGSTRIAGTDRYKRSKPTQAQMWVVAWMAREQLSDDRAEEVRVTVIATGSDDAYREARHELSERFVLGFPVSAEPVVAP